MHEVTFQAHKKNRNVIFVTIAAIQFCSHIFLSLSWFDHFDNHYKIILKLVAMFQLHQIYDTKTQNSDLI